MYMPSLGSVYVIFRRTAARRAGTQSTQSPKRAEAELEPDDLLRVQPLARHLRGTKVLSSSLKFDLAGSEFRD
jgi:hypothetical protein